jgi:hypothetical protein
MARRKRICPEALAEAGDIAGLFQYARERPLVLDLASKVRLLRIALGAAAKKDFDDSVGLVYQLMINFTADLLVISQTVASRRVEQMAEKLNSNHDTFVRDALESLLPQIERLHHHLITLTKAYATTSHTQKLGKRDIASPLPPADPQRVSVSRPTTLKLVRETEELVREQEVMCG